jgi:hypothetical protein
MYTEDTILSASMNLIKQVEKTVQMFEKKKDIIAAFLSQFGR